MKIAYLLMASAMLLAPCAALAQETAPVLTQEELISIVGEAVVEEAADASEEVRKAKEVVDAIRNRRAATREERAKAEEDLKDAEARSAKAQKNLDQARLDGFADQCGKTPGEIQAMRDSGMGWGVIAKQCGIHPSAAGKGKGQGKDQMKDKGKSKDKTKDKKKK